MSKAPSIKKMRLSLGMSQTEFAAFVGTSQPSISRWEERGIPSYPIYKAILADMAAKVRAELKKRSAA